MIKKTSDMNEKFIRDVLDVNIDKNLCRIIDENKIILNII